MLPNAEPRLTKRAVEIGGFRYPAGVVLLASAQLLHHDPEITPSRRVPARALPGRRPAPTRGSRSGAGLFFTLDPLPRNSGLYNHPITYLRYYTIFEGTLDNAPRKPC